MTTARASSIGTADLPVGDVQQLIAKRDADAESV